MKVKGEGEREASIHLFVVFSFFFESVCSKHFFIVWRWAHVK